MPASPEELPEPTEDNLAEVEACCGAYVLAVVECLGRMAEVFRY